ncbi:MAG: acyl carrier protein [Defluviitaleaceae bacterium]|nr:acyl carrier protein [Defluviitaleaceae bacterium]
MIFDKIREIIVTQMAIEPEKINMDTSFSADLNADSLDIFQIITELEESFEMEFDSEALEKVKTVGDAVRLLEKTQFNA